MAHLRGMVHCGRMSRCQSAACNIMKEVETISNIDYYDQTLEVSLAVLEAKRTIINAQLDEMIQAVKAKDALLKQADS